MLWQTRVKTVIRDMPCLVSIRVRRARRRIPRPHRPQTPDAVGPVDALAFYRQILPFIAQAVLVAVPSLWGMRQGANLGRFPPMLRIVLWTAAISTLGVLVIQEPGFGFFLRPFWRPWMWHAWQVSLLQMLVYWPVVYWTASAVWRRRHGRTASI